MSSPSNDKLKQAFLKHVKSWKEKISKKTARICMVGLGYVGLPTILEFYKAGFKTWGLDVSEYKIEQLKKGKSYVEDVPDNLIKKAVDSGMFVPTTDPSEAYMNSDFIIIAVPTPLDENELPDMSYLENASEVLAKHLKPGHFVIIESTTYPTTTEEFIRPILEESGLLASTDFGLAFSPERIDPGNKKYKVPDIPKIVGGMTREETDVAAKLYETIIKAGVYKAKNPRTAEAVKIVENTFRAVNIALVNELALIFQKLDINAYEVIELAKTKPFAFMAHYPGPGAGGHCIPVDPLYLFYKAKQIGMQANFIEHATKINRKTMPEETVKLVIHGLNLAKKSVNGSKLVILGVSYKPNVSDTRETPARLILEKLHELGAELVLHDPLVKKFEVKEDLHLESVDSIQDAMKNADALVIITDHDMFKKYDFSNLLEKVNKPFVIIDTRNMLDGISREDTIYCGLGKPLPNLQH